MHLGRNYPMIRDIRLHWLNLFARPYTLPRCWQLVVKDSAVGTRPQKWEGLTVISTPFEFIADYQEIYWEWIHPDDSDSKITHRMWWIELSPQAYPNSNFNFRFEKRYIEGGTTWGITTTAQSQAIECWKNSPPTNPMRDTLGLNWVSLVNPAEFGTIGRYDVGPATWEQQRDDYHPYRRDP